jgi:hypothetical protein
MAAPDPGYMNLWVVPDPGCFALAAGLDGPRWPS